MYPKSKSRLNLYQLPLAGLQIRYLVILIALGITGPTVSGQQHTKDAAEFLPPSTALYVHAAKPAALIDTIENHEIVTHVLELEPVQKLMRSPQFAMFMLGKGLLETNIESSVIDALKTNMAGGLWLGLDAESGGAIVIFKSSDEAKLKRTIGQVLKFAATTAMGDGDQVPFKKQEYRDAVAADFGNNMLIARYQSWFMLSNKSGLVKKVIDNMHDGTSSPLSDQNWFKQAIANRSDSDIWATVDLDAIRKKSGGGGNIFTGRTDNPGVELIFGGMLDALKHSPVATASVNIQEDIDFSIAAPFRTEWADEARDYFFGKDLEGRAPLVLQPKNMIASLTSHRDIGKWWLSKEDLYAENVIAQLAQADSQLSTIFSGMDFGEDVLGSLQPGIQVVIAENKYDEKYQPDVRLPAFALIGKLKDPKKLTRKLKIAFQSLIGFANINLGMSGQPQLEVETENLGDTKILASSYYYEDGTEEGLILFNFGPTIAFKGSNIVVSSTKDFAIELTKLMKTDAQGQSPSELEPNNTRIKIDGQMLHKILTDNIESLVVQNMLEEGNDREEARSQMDLVLLIADLFKEVGIDYDVTSAEMKLDLTIRFDDVSESKSSSTNRDE